ncbi:hypothetical protein AAY473_035487 [Plecturocebus cupreus]
MTPRSRESTSEGAENDTERRRRKLLGWWLHWLLEVPFLRTRRTGGQCHHSAAAPGLGPQSHPASRPLQRSLASARLVKLPPPQPSREPQTPVQFPSAASSPQQRRSDQVRALSCDTRSREAVEPGAAQLGFRGSVIQARRSRFGAPRAARLGW